MVLSDLDLNTLNIIDDLTFLEECLLVFFKRFEHLPIWQWTKLISHYVTSKDVSVVPSPLQLQLHDHLYLMFQIDSITF